jgi:RNA polymerase sigma-70 factor (ECF subfamily)
MTTASGSDDGAPDPGLAAIMRERGQLIGLAYRLLGSLADAEDAVQETYARWYALSAQQRLAIESPGAWLTTVASRICLDLLGSARARRERYVGEWLPEPLPDTTRWGDGALGHPAADPADRVTLDESVSMAFLVVLDTMTAAERVAFILHDVFRYSFAEVAEIVGRTPSACRQLASSARRRLRASRVPAAPAARQADIVRSFKDAWATKDIDALIGLLDPDATAIADGGGLVTARHDPIDGAEQIARHYLDIAGRAPDSVVILECTVNGQPGLVMQHDGVAVTVFAFGFDGDRIKYVWAVRNPEKLRLWRAEPCDRASPAPDPAVEYRLWLILRPQGAAHQEVEVAALVGLKNVLDVHAGVAAGVARRRRGAECGPSLGQLGVGEQHIELACMGVKRDDIAVAHQGQRPSRRRFRAHMENASPIRGSAHPGVGDADHVGDALFEQLAGNRQLAPLGHAGGATRSG